jgi:hypothetical protein
MLNSADAEATTFYLPDAQQAQDVSDARLEAIAKEIESIQQTAITQIAKLVAEARDLYRYHRNEGGFAGWAEKRLGYTRQTAYNLIHVHERFGGENLSNRLDTFHASVLYLLAAPSTPESARKEVMRRAATGEQVSVADAKRTIQKHRAKDIKPVTDETTGATKINGNEPKGEPESSDKTKTVRLRRSILQVWETGDSVEQDLLCDIVIAEYFATATGANLFQCIPANNRNAVISELLDRLGAEGLRQTMSPELKREFQKRTAVKGKSINLTASSTVSGETAGNRGARSSEHLGKSNGQ